MTRARLLAFGLLMGGACVITGVLLAAGLAYAQEPTAIALTAASSSSSPFTGSSGDLTWPAAAVFIASQAMTKLERVADRVLAFADRVLDRPSREGRPWPVAVTVYHRDDDDSTQAMRRNGRHVLDE